MFIQFLIKVWSLFGEIWDLLEIQKPWFRIECIAKMKVEDSQDARNIDKKSHRKCDEKTYPKNRPIFHPKWSKIEKKMRSQMHQTFNAFLDAFLIENCFLKLMQKWPQIESPRGVQRTTFWTNLSQLEPTWPTWSQLGPTWPNIGPRWANFEPTWSQLGANLEPTWTNLEPTLANLMPTWANLKPTWANLGPT